MCASIFYSRAEIYLFFLFVEKAACVFALWKNLEIITREHDYDLKWEKKTCTWVKEMAYFVFSGFSTKS